MIRYISGSKKSKVESQIYDWDGRNALSLVFMVLTGIAFLGLLVVYVQYDAMYYICVLAGIEFSVSLIVFLISSSKLKQL